LWSETYVEQEGSELSEKIGQLKIISTDWKYYKTDVADTEQLFRLIQSILSPKAELPESRRGSLRGLA
jgi:hypothetical protein